MHAEICAIGTELLMGELLDANSAWLAARLPVLGIELRRVSLLGDHLTTLSDAMVQALQGVDLDYHDRWIGAHPGRPDTRGHGCYHARNAHRACGDSPGD